MQVLNVHLVTGLERSVMSRTTTSPDPRNVTSAREALAGMVEVHVNATGLGVVGAVAGFGDTCGLGFADGLEEASGLGFGEGLASATWAALGVCWELGLTLPQAVRASRTRTKTPFLMLAITLRAIDRYERISSLSWHKH